MQNLPLRDAPPEVFARVRDCFLRAGFTEETVTRTPQPAADSASVPADAAGLLVGLFLHGAATDPETISATLGRQCLDDLLALGLLRADSGNLRATMRICPMEQIYMVSDLWDVRAGRNQSLADDVVFPPDTPQTRSFLAYLPQTPCERLLEACGGAGPAALIGAHRYARHAASFDITERSTACAAFSARLNGLTNIDARAGDAFAPAAGERYDRIVAHPPYVPVLQPTWIYRDGGPDGEQITRKHVEQLAGVLAPGGHFYCRAIGSDRAGQNFEDRVRTWLGPDASEFDIVVIVLRRSDPVSFAMQNILGGRISIDDLPLWENAINERQIVSLFPIWLVIHRQAKPRQPFTIRRLRTQYSGPKELDWLLRWETLRAEGRAEEAILENRLTAAPSAMLVRNQIREGQWQTATRQLHVEFPYLFECDVDAMGSFLLPRCNGTLTGLQLLQSFIADGVVRPDADPSRFAAVLADLVSGGFLYVRGHEPAEPRLHIDCVCCSA